jgi:hypothetical protein
MAHLWIRTGAGQWDVLPLDAGAFDLTASPPRAVAPGAARTAVLRRAEGQGEPVWLLLAASGAGVSVNGLPAPAGIRVLADRDEIQVDGGGPLIFSTEALARSEPFPGFDRTIFCPRCKLEIERGAQSVKCPACGIWHHQTEELPCWTYASSCALCPQPTGLETGYRWTPEEL